MKTTGIILAAGLGTRLKPSTDHCPKPLIPVAGVEPLFFALEAFYKVGIRKVVINSHYLPEKIESALKAWAPLFPGLQHRISLEHPEILGTGGGVLKILRDSPDWFRGHGILLQNGDTLTDVPRQLMLDDPAQSRFAISIKPIHLKRYKPLWVDADGQWVGIGASSQVEGATAAHFLGLHFVSSAAVEKIYAANWEVRSIDLFNGIYRPLSDEGFRFEAKVFLEKDGEGSFWFDMNTPEYLLEAQKYLMDSMMRSNTWIETLKMRYPNIHEFQKGVWVSSKPESSLPSFRAPAIFVVKKEAAGAPPERNQIEVGPHAALLWDGGRRHSSSQAPVLKLENSVLVVGPEHSGEFPTRVGDQVCVIP